MTMVGADLPVGSERPRFSSQEVARYYDSNTRRFLRFGQGGGAGVLHRAVWGPGVEDRRAAFQFVHGLVLEQLEAGPSAGRGTVLDLGSGAGATLEYLLERAAVRGVGVTVSRLQHRLASRRLERTFGDRVELHCADFCLAPVEEPVELCVAIESFAHATDPGGFFRQVKRCLRPGGRLVICDDFRVEGRAREGASGPLRDFETGWHLSSLLTPRQVDRLAAEAGLALRLDRDLTPHLELDRARDRWIAMLVRVLRPLRRSADPRWSSVAGGDALRRSISAGSVQYRFRVWERMVAGCGVG